MRAWLLVLIVVFPFNCAIKNPFAQLNAKWSSKGKESQSARPDAVKLEEKQLKELLELREGLSNVRVAHNSRDEVLSSALNMISSVSSALIYSYLIKAAMRGIMDLVNEFSRMSSTSGNITSGSLPEAFEKRYIPANVTLNSFELDILSGSVVDPESIDTDFETIGGLSVVKEGLLDCCDLCLGLDLVQPGPEEDGEAGAGSASEDEAKMKMAIENTVKLTEAMGEGTTPKEAVEMAAATIRVSKRGVSASRGNSTTEAGGEARAGNPLQQEAGPMAMRSNTLLRPVQGVLLYGPPGCGKTALTRSLGRKRALPIVQISPSTLLRKWVGDTSQLTKAIFTLCHKLQPCILFIDEMDGLFRSRREDDNAVDRQVKTEFMQLWDGLSRSADSRVLVIGATNRPQDLDAAIQRRFERSYLVSMPDERARSSIIRKLLRGGDVQTGPYFDVKACAAMTAGYSPSDIVNLLKTAACIPLRELQRDRRNGTAAPTLRPLSLADVEEAKQSLGQPTQWTAHGYNGDVGYPSREGAGGDIGNGWAMQPRGDLRSSPSFGGGEGWAPGTVDKAGDLPPWSQSPPSEELYKDYEDFDSEDEDEDEDENEDDGED